MFGQKKTLKEHVRENQRGLRKENRNMDREYQRLLIEEKKVQSDIKQAAKKGDQATMKALAKQVIYLRKQQQKCQKMKGNMTALSHKTNNVMAQDKINKAMKTSSNVLGSMNAQMDPKEMNEIMKNFSKQNEMMNMREEMMDDTLDDIFDDEDVEEDVSQAMDEVLDEIGIEVGGKLSSIKTSNKNPPQKNDMSSLLSEDVDDDELISRLTKLQQ